MGGDRGKRSCHIVGFKSSGLHHYHQVLQGNGIDNPTPDMEPGAREKGRSYYPIKGYVEANLQICGIKGYNIGISILFIPAISYGEEASIIFWVQRLLTKQWTPHELNQAIVTWTQTHLSTILSQSASSQKGLTLTTMTTDRTRSFN